MNSILESSAVSKQASCNLAAKARLGAIVYLCPRSRRDGEKKRTWCHRTLLKFPWRLMDNVPLDTYSTSAKDSQYWHRAMDTVG